MFQDMIAINHINNCYHCVHVFFFFDCAGSSYCTGCSLPAAIRGYSLVAVHRVLTAVASLVAEHRL